MLYFILTILSILFTYLVFKSVQFLRRYIQARSLPGPPVYSLIRGNSVNSQESADDLHQFIKFRAKWLAKYPKLCRFVNGPFIQIVCCHPDSVKTIINDNYPKHPIYEMLSKWIGDGLLTSKGKKWFNHRKMLTPGFHYEILDGFFEVYSDCVGVLIDNWSKESNEKGYIILQDSIPYLTLDIILQCICSVKTNCQIIRDKLEYVKDVAIITRILQIRMRSPLRYYSDFMFHWSRLGNEFTAACLRAKQFTYDVILERKRLLAEGDTSRNSKYRDFLDILLHATDPVTGTSLTDQEIRDEVDTFVFEGHDTTASGVIWTLYLLAKHVKYQDMCRQELFEIWDGESILDKSTIQKLKLLPLCIKESLRMYPPVAGVLRQPSQSCTLAGYPIPPRSFVTIGIRQMHNNANVWENPEEFNPNRFSDENIVKMHHFSYLPFSAGPRNCIGQNMALHEMNAVISRILARFKLDLPTDFPDEVEIDMNIILKPKTPLKLLLSPI